MKPYNKHFKLNNCNFVTLLSENVMKINDKTRF